MLEPPVLAWLHQQDNDGLYSQRSWLKKLVCSVDPLAGGLGWFQTITPLMQVAFPLAFVEQKVHGEKRAWTWLSTIRLRKQDQVDVQLCSPLGLPK
jgi:hypothetical protein